MSLQLVTHSNCRKNISGDCRKVDRNRLNTYVLPPMGAGGHTLATMRRPAMRRIQPTASAAAIDVALQPTIEEAVSRWIDQNPSQLYRGGA